MLPDHTCVCWLKLDLQVVVKVFRGTSDETLKTQKVSTSCFFRSTRSNLSTAPHSGIGCLEHSEPPKYCSLSWHNLQIWTDARDCFPLYQIRPDALH